MSSPAPAARASRSAESALHTIEIERQALATLAAAFSTSDLGAAFDKAAALIAASSGRVAVTGMGKSGLVGRKIAATFASTGTPAFYLHPAEASHGDLGMITPEDVVLALSWSGETREMSDVLTHCRRFRVPLIAMTSGVGSTLAEHADIVLTMPIVEEACPNNLAPTSSTTLQATLGDALAVALIELRGFSSDDFHVYHPKGRLAARLLTVGQLMSAGDAVPRVGSDASLFDATLEMSAKRFGITAITGADGELVGAFSDGDLRRSLQSAGTEGRVCDHMTSTPLSMQPDRLVSEALAVMNAHKISQMFVCRGTTLIGILHIHDILRAGVA